MSCRLWLVYVLLKIVVKLPWMKLQCVRSVCQILPGIQNTDPAVRNKAVKSLGLCCLRSIDLARERIVLLLQVKQK